MAAANPQPLQARPFQEHVQVPSMMADDDGEYEDGGGGGGGGDVMDDVEEAHMTSVSVANHGGLVMASRASELTLSFEGEVYVFPEVTPEKVSYSHFCCQYICSYSRCYVQFEQAGVVEIFMNTNPCLYAPLSA